MKRKSSKSPLIGTIKTLSNGSAIASIENVYMEDVFISDKDLNGSFNHDQVEIQIDYNSYGFRTSGKVIKINKRDSDKFVGRATLIKDKWYLKEEVDRQQNIILHNHKEFELEENSIIRVEILDWRNKKKQIIAKIIKLLANPNDTFADLELIVGKHNIPKRHSADAISESLAFNQEKIDKEVNKRFNCQHLNTFTIDPENAKDFDDALSIESHDKYYKLGVHIADVSQFISPESKMDKEAIKRGNSYYFSEKSFPMFPENIANNICSLKPKVARLTLSIFLKLDKKFNLISYEYKKSVIKSDRRYRYSEVDDILKGKRESIFKTELLNLKMITENWRRKRFLKGGIDLDIPKINYRVNRKGVPYKFKKEINTTSHQIVEECMLMANEITAKKMNSKLINSIFRNHKAPSLQQISKLSRMIDILGIKKNFNNESFSPHNINIFIHSIKNSNKSSIAKSIILRSLNRAEYSSKNEGHFGLGFENYTHFTSPIRRYSDLIIHRILKGQLFNEPVQTDSVGMSVFSANEGEKRSTYAERDYNKLKLLRWMKHNKNNTFKSLITKLDKFFIHAQIIHNGAEGVINLKSISNDTFTLSANKNSLIGREKKEIFRLGDKINIDIKKVDIFDKISIFQIADLNTKKVK